jgi:hypothetical protein
VKGSLLASKAFDNGKEYSSTGRKGKGRIALHSGYGCWSLFNLRNAVVHQKPLAPLLHVQISGVIVSINPGLGVGWVQNGIALKLLFDEKSLISLVPGLRIKPDPIIAVSHEPSGRPTSGRMRTDYWQGILIGIQFSEPIFSPKFIDTVVGDLELRARVALCTTTDSGVVL